MKLGDGKGSNTGNELDNSKDLKKQNFTFKRNIKYLKKKFTNKTTMMKDMIRTNLKILVTNFEVNSLRRSLIKIEY